MKRDGRQLWIGELARESGVPARTLRFYEALGLLAPPGRTSSGYRVYGPQAIERLRFITRAKKLGLKLRDIGTILAISDRGRAPCEHMLALVDRDVSRLDDQIESLIHLRGELTSLRERLVEALASGPPAEGVCPCLEESPWNR